MAADRKSVKAVDWSEEVEANALADRIVELGQEVKDLSEERDGLRARLFELQEDAEADKVTGDTWESAIARPKPLRKLSAEKLLENGVKVETIEKSYVDVARNPYLTVKAKKV